MQFISILALFTFTLSCTLAFDTTLNQDWNLWKEANNKYYSNAEEKIRRDIWESNLKIVQEHNLQADLGVHTYWLGMNKYADMTNDEFVRVMTGYNTTKQDKNKIHRDTFTFNSNIDLPDTVDWRTKGCVTSVHNQGQCGASAIFSVVGGIEGLYCIHIGKLVPLSYQQVLDCSGIGCTGGTPEQVYAYLVKAGGLETEASYPYSPTGKCRFDPTKIVVKVTGFTEITSKNENALQQAVATVGPIAAAIDASHTSFQLYRGGVYNEPSCSQTQLDHDILIVGYGIESGQDYWIVKNSWGTSWGEQGYIKMTRNKNNQCGIATDANYANI